MNRILSVAVAWRCSLEKMFSKISQNLQENTSARVSFLIKVQVATLSKKKTLAKVLSCEFCGIFKNTFFIVACSGEKVMMEYVQKVFYRKP